MQRVLTTATSRLGTMSIYRRTTLAYFQNSFPWNETREHTSFEIVLLDYTKITLIIALTSIL